MAYDGFKEFVEEVRSRNSIIDIIGEDTELERRGNKYFCKSPFRPDKDPSFVIYPQSESWFDFGTREFGDVFNYIEKRMGCNFSEAVEILAERCGIEPYWLKKDFTDSNNHGEELSSYNERLKIEHILTLATAYYHKNLPEDIRQDLLVVAMTRTYVQAFEYI